MTVGPYHREFSIRFYFGILVALFALTLLSFFTAREWDAHLPTAARIPIALTIAVAKATLVAIFFMHLGGHTKTSVVYVVTALALLALLVGMVVGDVATRLPTANPNFTGFTEKRGAW